MFDTGTLMQLADQPHPVGFLAQACLAGEDASPMLWDALLEGDYRMFEEVGKRYLFKTLAHYYEGVVTRVNFAQIEIRDVTMIFRAGDMTQTLESRAWTRREKYTDPERCEILIRSTLTGITYLGDL